MPNSTYFVFTLPPTEVCDDQFSDWYDAQPFARPVDDRGILLVLRALTPDPDEWIRSGLAVSIAG